MSVTGNSIAVVRDHRTIVDRDPDHFWPQDSTQVLKVTSKFGLQLVATPDITILTNEGYKHISQLYEGCPITVFPSSIHGQDELVPTFNIPWSRSVGRLMGLLTAVGNDTALNYSGFLVGFDPEDEPLAHEFKDSATQILGIPTRISHYRTALGNDRVRLHALHSPLVQDFFEMCTRDHVNSGIWSAPRDAIMGFVEGYFAANGTVDPSNGQLTIYSITTSETFAREFQLLMLQSLKIRTKISVTASERTPDRNRYRLRIEKSNVPMFLAQISLLRKSLSEKVANCYQKSFRQDKYDDAIASVVKAPIAEVYELVSDLSSTVYVNGFRIQ